MTLKYLPLFLASFAPAAHAQSSRPVAVKTADEFRRAVAAAKPGARIDIAPGTYSGSFFFANARGAQGKSITIGGADAKRPPVIKGSLQFSDAAFLTLHSIAIEDSPANGLNIDDGDFDNSARGITIRNVRVSDGRGEGNLDGIKLSGLQNFLIEGCTVERWGTEGGGIDMVGCHNGIIRNCLLRYEPGKGDTGIQAKGGCRDVKIQRTRFENTGHRGVNVGGWTDDRVFRPRLDRWFPGLPKFEAKDITVEGCTFVGTNAPLAFVGVDGAVARFNTIYKPERWALRILQEKAEPGFVSCRNVRFTDNLVVWDSRKWVEGGVNIGPGAAPQTFAFRRNWWFCEDKPDASRPALPTAEAGGIYGRNPLFVDVARGDFRLKPTSPARKVGANAFKM